MIPKYILCNLFGYFKWLQYGKDLFLVDPKYKQEFISTAKESLAFPSFR
jgi:hypothetical protein